MRYQSVMQRFLEIVKCYPDRPALWVDNIILTYQQLYEKASSIAAVLYSLPCQRCVVVADRSQFSFIVLFAILLADKTYVPLNSKLPAQAQLNIFQKMDADVVIMDHYNVKVMQWLKQFESSVMILTSNDFSNRPTFINNQYYNNNAYLIFTSGSTGQPKGVMVSHGNILHYIDNIIDRCKPNQYDRFTQLSELSFDFSIHDIFVAWSVGACIYVMTTCYLLHLKNFIHENKITFWASVPSLLLFLKNSGQLIAGAFPSLRYSLFCGEVLSCSLAKAWQHAAPLSIIDNLYGPTEAAVACTGYRWHSDSSCAADSVPIGFPFPKLSIAIIDECGQQASVGELYLSGSQVVSGYWRDTQLTHERFVCLPYDAQRWYRTHDRVRWDENAGLVYLGRTDDQMKLRGICVSKIEIELALRSLLSTESIAVVPCELNDEGILTGIIAYIAGMNDTDDLIWNKIRQSLPEHMIPKHIIRLNYLPTTISGKIDYQSLKNYA